MEFCLHTRQDVLQLFHSVLKPTKPSFCHTEAIFNPALSGEDGRLDSCDQRINGACSDVFVLLPHHCSACACACLLTRADAECAASACVGCSVCVPRVLHPSDTTSGCMRGRVRNAESPETPVPVLSCPGRGGWILRL